MAFSIGLPSGNGIKAASASAAAQIFALQKAGNIVVLAVYAAYLQAVLAKELAIAALTQIQQTAFQLKAVQKKAAVGAAAEFDLAQFRLQLLKDSAALSLAKEAEGNSLLQLKAVLALEASTNTDVQFSEANELSTEAFPVSAEALYQKALSVLPQIGQGAHQTEAARLRVRLAKTARLPSLSLYASLGTNYVNIASPQRYTYIPQLATGAKV